MLSKSSQVDAYMRDIQRYPVLSHEEQHSLAMAYSQTGDTKAAARLVTSNLRLVVKIANNYNRKNNANLLDMIQEGNIGLMQAVRKYDPYRGIKLTSYAAWWIRAYIIKFAIENHRLVKIGGKLAHRKVFFHLNKERAKLQAMGIDPTTETLAKRLNVDVEDIHVMDKGRESSLNLPLKSLGGEESSYTIVDTIPSEWLLPDAALIAKEKEELIQDKVLEFYGQLNGREATIFKDLFLSKNPTSLVLLGESFGVSKQRINQIVNSIKNRLLVFLADQEEDVREELLQ